MESKKVNKDKIKITFLVCTFVSKIIFLQLQFRGYLRVLNLEAPSVLKLLIEASSGFEMVNRSSFSFGNG